MVARTDGIPVDTRLLRVQLLHFTIHTQPRGEGILTGKLSPTTIITTATESS